MLYAKCHSEKYPLYKILILILTIDGHDISKPIGKILL